MEPSPRHAAVVVAYHSGPDLGLCLDSIRRAFEAMGTTGEIVVVDNGGGEGAEDPEVSALAGEPGVRVLRPGRNLGFGAGVNLGFRGTAAARVLILNPDATLDAGSLDALDRAIDDGAPLAAPRLILPDGTDQDSPRRFYDLSTLLRRRVPGLQRLLGPVPLKSKDADGPAGGGSVDWVTGAAMLIDRAAVMPRGPFDERYFLYVEDVDLCRRLHARGTRVRFVPEARVRHRFAAASRVQVPWNSAFRLHVHSGLLYAMRWHGFARGFRCAVAAAADLGFGFPLAVSALVLALGASVFGAPWPVTLAAALLMYAAAPALARIARSSARRWGFSHEAMLLAGNRDEAAEVVDRAAAGAEPGLTVEGFISATPGLSLGPDLGPFSTLVDQARALHVDTALLCGDSAALSQWVGQVHALRRAGVRPLFLLSGPEELLRPPDAEERASLPVVGLGAGIGAPITLPLTLAAGRLAACVLLLLAGPLLLLAAARAAIRHRQSPWVALPRLGEEGRPFSMWRLRSGAGPEGDVGGFLLDRVVRRTHIDELPQLWNVARGEMALVGPRPIDAAAAARLETWERARFVVRPGISGLWQLDRVRRFRLHEMIAADLRYVLRWSPGLDLRILAETLLPARSP